MSLADLVRTYYIDPMILGEGYNLVNTLTYALLAVFAVYFAYKYVERIKLKIDRKFVIGIVPLVLFGTLIRLFEEAGIYKSYFLVTPLIWIEAFALVFVLFLAARYLERRLEIPYYKTLFAIGVILSAVPLVVLLAKVVQVTGMIITLALLLPIAAVLYLVKWRVENKFATLAHAFDATATFTAIQFFGFREMHVVPRLLIDYFSPASFIAVKLIAVAAVLILIDKYSEDRNFNNFLKFAIAVIGFAPAVRDFFLLGF